MANWECYELRDFWSLIPDYLGADIVNFTGVCREFHSHGENYIYSRRCNLDLAYSIRQYIDFRKYIIAILGNHHDGADIDIVANSFIIKELLTEKKAISSKLWDDIVRDSELFDMFYYFTCMNMVILVPYSIIIPYRPVVPTRGIFWYNDSGYFMPTINMEITESQLLSNLDILDCATIDKSVINIIKDNPDIILRFPLKYARKTRYLCTRVFKHLGYNPIIGIQPPTSSMQKYAPLAYCLHYREARRIGWTYHADYEIFNNRL